MISKTDLERLYEIFVSCGAVCTDSRRVAGGEMFFALGGENFDGNRFAVNALESGASVAVVDDGVVAVDRRYIVVDDVLEALQALARRHREQLAIPILAITGSNGKTTTKELVARVLVHKFRLSVTQGNLNNHIGVPLTLLAMDSETQFGVVEMGASSQGEIALLCSIAKPNYGIITNIGRAHLEGFGGGDGVERGKGELLDWLAEHEGTAFYLSDDQVISRMVEERSGTSLKTVAYRATDGALPSHLEGDYNQFNIAAAVAVGRYFGVSDSDIAAGVWSYVPDNNRSQRVDTDLNVFILDCYNANPSSMAAAIANFGTTVSPNGYAKCAILGDMMELGEFAQSEHRKVIGLLADAGVEQVFLVGTNFMLAGEGTPHKLFATTESLCQYLTQNPLNHRFILVKGSRSIGLERVLATQTQSL